MIMSQCRYVNNRNFKTEISLSTATFSSAAAERNRKRLPILCYACMRTEHTCVSCLCLSSDKMAAMANTKPVRQLKNFGNTANLRNHLARYPATCCRCQQENNQAGSGTASTKLREQCRLPNPLQLLLYWIQDHMMLLRT